MSMEEKRKAKKEPRQSGVLFVQLPPKLKLEFKLACTEAGVSMNDVVTSMVRDAVKALKQRKN